jgi:hypothetical protein
MYDFNVVYCNMGEEGETVAESITNVLEDYGLNGYYSGRDCKPGRNIMMEFYRVTSMSKYTMLVIDKEFLEHPWPLYLGESTMGYFAVETAMGCGADEEFLMMTINTLIVIYVGVTEDHVARRFPHFNVRLTLYFPAATLRKCDKIVLGMIALGICGFTDVDHLLAQLEEGKTSKGHE